MAIDNQQDLSQEPIRTFPAFLAWMKPRKEELNAAFTAFVKECPPEDEASLLGDHKLKFIEQHPEQRIPVAEAVRNGKIDLQAVLADREGMVKKIGFVSGGEVFLDLSFSDLSNLPKDLKGAFLQGVVLSGSNLESTNLEDANMQAVKAVGVNFKNANLENANLAHALLRNANFTIAILKKAQVVQAYLTGAKLCGADCSDASFCLSVLYKTDFSQADCSDADFAGAVLEEADLSQAICKKAWFVRSSLLEAKLCRADCSDASFFLSFLCKTDFSQADCSNADFAGAVLDRKKDALHNAKVTERTLDSLRQIFLLEMTQNSTTAPPSHSASPPEKQGPQAKRSK